MYTHTYIERARERERDVYNTLMNDISVNIEIARALHL